MFGNWFSRRRSAAPATHPARLELECLESRQLPSTISAASSTAVYVVRPDSSVWENTPAFGSFPLTGPGFATDVSAVAETNTNVVFALSPAGVIFAFRPSVGWIQLGGNFDAISAGLDQNGVANVFGHTKGNGLYEFNSQGAFHLGDFISSMSASNNDVVVAILTNKAVFAHSAAAGWFALTSPGFAQSVTIYPDSNGNQVVFAVTPAGQLFTYTFAGGWSFLGVVFDAASAGRDRGGNGMVFAHTGVKTLYEFFPSQGTVALIGQFVADMSGADSGRVFVILLDGSVFSFDDRFGWVPLAPAGFAMV